MAMSIPVVISLSGQETTGPYCLTRPTLHEAHSALRSLYGPHTDDLWQTLLFSAGLTGEETASSALDRLLVAMQAAPPLVQLCGRGLRVRVAAYESLARAHAEK
jgi:hypothetical protein